MLQVFLKNQVQMKGLISSKLNGLYNLSFEMDWARHIITECHDQGVKVFIKQLPAIPLECPDPVDGVCRHPEHWPEDLRVQELPKT